MIKTCVSLQISNYSNEIKIESFEINENVYTMGNKKDNIFMCKIISQNIVDIIKKSIENDIFVRNLLIMLTTGSSLCLVLFFLQHRRLL